MISHDALENELPMNHIDGLRKLCSGGTRNLPPYLVRTRFERHLYGLLTEISLSTFGKKLRGPSEQQVREFLASVGTHGMHKQGEALMLGAKIYQKFTYLSDTGYSSDDGQDPRIHSCEKDTELLCRIADSLIAAIDDAGHDSQSRYDDTLKPEIVS
jgi:hypothetical protein